jgi:NADH-quinone oxidoreductase subunit C
VALPDAGNVEDYSKEEMDELLGYFATDKGKLTKLQKAAVARYNFKLGKGEAINFRGATPPAAPAVPSPAAPAAPTAPAAPPEAPKPTPEELARQAAEAARAKALGFPHVAKLNDKFGSAIELWSMQVHAPVATVASDRILDIVRYLHMEMGFDYLRNLTAADYAPERFEVVYHLKNIVKNTDLALRVKLSRDAPAGSDMPHLPSVVGIHPGADWLEREVFDLFGIRFDGHPYMRRLMMPDGWVGHPLRKDYDGSKEQFVGLGADGHDIVSFNKEDGW